MGRRVIRPPVRREVDDEFAFHVDMRVRDLVAEGWDEGEARAEAVRRFGDMERVKSDCRDLGEGREGRMMRRQGWDELRQDLAFAVRQLRREPAFAAVAVLTLALAVGANAAVFSVVNAVLLRPLPYPDADRLVAVWTRYLPPSGFDIDKFDLSGPEVLDLRDETRTLQSVGVWYSGSVELTGDGDDAARIRVGRFSRDMFPVLGVAPLHGRWFSEEEDRADATPVALLGFDLWTNRYGGDPGIVGRSLTFNGESVEVVGVMPEGFEPFRGEAWVPLRLDRTNEGNRAGHGFGALARMAPGAAPADVDAELAVLNDRWAAEHEHNVAHLLWAQPLKDEIVRDAPRILTLLAGAVALVLLVACANVANLLLARGERRQAEVPLPTALGAGRGRIVRQLLTESLVLAGLAAALGLALARVGTASLIALDPGALPRLADVRVDVWVVLFTVAASVVTALTFGVLPAALAGRRPPTSSGGAGSRATGGRRRGTLRRALVAGEVAVSLVVVILAGLTTRSLGALARTDPGFSAEGVLTFSMSLPTARYPDGARTPEAYRRLTERLAALPGVSSVAMADRLPFAGTISRWDFQLDDRPPRQDGELARNAQVSLVGAGYFETLGIPLLEGRGFRESDGPDDARVGVVSAGFARTWWPGESALGKRWGYEKADADGQPYVPWITVVGVVPEQYTSRVDEEAVPQIYLPHAQAGSSGYYWPRSMNVALRVDGAPLSVVPAVRAAVAEFDANLPLAGVRTLESAVRDSMAQPRLTTNLLGAFAVLALLLATVGIYGVVSYTVAGRTREIGVRVALGAGRGQVARMVVREGARPLLAGVAVGLAAAWFAARSIEGMLYEVEATDPATFALLPVALLVVGVLASLVPALRATGIPPTEALRQE